ncbi:hypothetical protein B0187_08690 [Haemophilus paracuniculus]|uniref:Rap1a immunity protein domain-containing protein n=1 Tax=Haemophilus paracuniculus TaxID=734 RepID=A0A1T0AQX0_9PAST|nr:hypothetical protein [Haemophilus paracuniculus]OOR98336.1 hypothetical protein B0187_08690 [Haemophilus paracuniculus]
MFKKLLPAIFAASMVFTSSSALAITTAEMKAAGNGLSKEITKMLGKKTTVDFITPKFTIKNGTCDERAALMTYAQIYTFNQQYPKKIQDRVTDFILDKINDDSCLSDEYFRYFNNEKSPAKTLMRQPQ